MKKPSKRIQIIVLSILSVLIVALGVGIALSVLSYEDPIEQPPEVAPLGNYDYSKRPFFASSEPTIYKGDIYCVDPYQWLRRVPISDYSCNMLTHEKEDFPPFYFVCTDESHNHTSKDPTKTCLGYKVGGFLIDAYESAGESPIIYRMRFFGFEPSAKDISGEIIRIDTGNMTDETIVSTSDSIEGMMTYDQWVFFMTVNAQGVYSINVISKKGGDLTTLEVGKHGWTLMYADDNYVYYQDSAGNIYRATLDLKNPEFIFYAETISAMDPEHVGTFIYGDYLYYEADYETVPYAIGLDTINFAKHTIRRVPLDNLQAESQVVAENVLDNYVFGVGNNVLYYQPCVMGESAGKDYYFNWSGGQVLGVNLDTLEQVEMVNDCGLDIAGKDSYASGNALFVSAFPIDDRYHQDRNGSMGELTLLYDTRTGALCPVSVNMMFG